MHQKQVGLLRNSRINYHNQQTTEHLPTPGSPVNVKHKRLNKTYRLEYFASTARQQLYTKPQMLLLFSECHQQAQQ